MKRILLIFFTALLLAPCLGYGQTGEFKERREELVKKQEATRAEINEINNQISQYEERLVLAEEKYDRLYNQYEDLKRLIALQDQKISKLETELIHIREEISVNEQQITENEKELQRLVENYKETLTYVYKHGRTSHLALIFSSSSVNQMLVRAYYLNKFEDHRLKQTREIKEATQELEQAKSQLEEAREKNTAVLAEIREEKKELAEKRDKQEKNVRLLRRNREQIEESIAQHRQQKQQLDETLTSVIAEIERIRKLEAERERKLAEAKSIENDAERAREVAKYSRPIEGNTASEEELTNLEQSFAKQKGQLRWPVESSTISEHFGRRRHPVYGTVTENLGVEIVTKPRDVVRVVHDGYVVAVQPLPGYGDVVIVKHGKYITAYGNLSQVMVRKNAVLEAGDAIGLAGDQNSARGESVFFMVREGNQNLNPEAWLANK
ncbi:peptidoglycan DD-metalloendopeptidase family protein [Aliifodinibius sp. S!AR15-10]|uniref:murein hydrolase activator EnvC family protein n=1 Tax=Aliifodinibius sp. S!AR15-10 TaxID=2950437 RepID=UPI00285FAD93|nr:peptidoglycan DD-metalloendopeptidase family protein [Aliifodinibius sp. S!AR15-10]MDR8390658.1 peptidoglycan DD-metalloendopeptidase family protein [Aliifodinibius sp. S!AR15-10]